jgi:DNA-binding CsgD family transcriptional regulator
MRHKDEKFSHHGQSEIHLSDIVTPHLFSAMRVNRAVTEAPKAVSGNQMDPVICSAAGLIHFVDGEVFKLFENEWADWKPPLLPSKVFDEMRSNGAMSYVGKSFVAKGRIFDNLLILSIVAKNTDSNLSKMEFLVASLLAEGASYKEIALQLGTSPATVRNQVHSIYLKLKVSRKSSVGGALVAQGYTEAR